jgi:hypothetical protein
MSRTALFNIFTGFLLIFVSAASGAFLASEITLRYLTETDLSDNWTSLIQKSAHGHTNLFGLLHICFGLTLPYSIATNSIKKFQTIGLLLGSFAMSILMTIRSIYIPNSQSDFFGLIIGSFLSFSLISIITHTIGLGAKLLRRG